MFFTKSKRAQNDTDFETWIEGGGESYIERNG